MSRSARALRDAVMLFQVARTPARVWGEIMSSGRSGFDDLWDSLESETQTAVLDQTHKLKSLGAGVLMATDPGYPRRLVWGRRPVAPILFYRGNLDLLDHSAVSMCGSRHVSPLGLRAAHACGYEAAHRGMVVVSGNASGVDTETHLSALQSGGATVLVLPEGILRFRVKGEMKADFAEDRTLVVSQFAPMQPWAAHAAMTRNQVIFGLGDALVVIEAGDRGGTLAAGEEALKAGRPVLVLNFGEDTPPGNEILLRKGGTPVKSRSMLGELLAELAPGGAPPELELGL